MKTRNLFLYLCLLMAVTPIYADGGMWTLDRLQQQMSRMKELGLKLSPEQIYNEKGSPALKDAVVFFDGGCSGVLVSSQSLLLTNHHCGYDKIQALSSVGANYLRDGFMSRRFEEELPCANLEVEIVEHIKDVTKEVKTLLKKNEKEMTTGMEYLSAHYLSTLAKKIDPQGFLRKGYRYEIKPFYGGNKYYMFVNKVFRDVRLVATPPSSIGKYGADTDNWIWPRHTGDFSIFRLYADSEGNSYGYDPGHKPYQTKKWIRISGKGVEKDDFAMILGFPGTTYHYFTGTQVEEWGNIDNKIRIEMRGIRQQIMLESMRADEKTEIMYAAKYANSQNGYKRAQGANWAIEKRDLRQMKKMQETLLIEKERKNGGNLAQNAEKSISESIKGRKMLRYRERYLVEGILLGTEFSKAPIANVKDLKQGGEKEQNALRDLNKDFASFYDKDYSPQLDKKIAKAMLTRYCERIDKKYYPKVLAQELEKHGSVSAYADYIFEKSVFASPQKLKKCLQDKNYDRLEKDPMSLFAASVLEEYHSLNKALLAFDKPMADAHRNWVKAHMDYDKEELWPDANLTLRFTYGQVRGYKPRDVVYYAHQSTMEGVMEKEDPTNPEYILPERLKEIYKNKDFGPYAMKGGHMPVNFCATTHTTGGNSGSPVFNAYGELIGLNFDRNWEGVGGDIEYLPDYQRSIILDIRYLMLIVDKYLGGKRLIDEMNPHF